MLHPDYQYTPKLIESMCYIIANDLYPYAKKVFDNSPLNRVMEHGAPGAAWQPQDASIENSGHTVEFNYLTNDAGEVKKWSVDNNGNCLQNGTYSANTLFKNETIDENENTVFEFIDLTGKTILKKTNDGTNDLLTYYVYDDFDRLRYVFPPIAVDQIGTTSPVTSTSFSELIYYYEYDHKGRMIEKKIPGADIIYMVYDKRDRLVLTQDGNLRDEEKWNFIKYDILNRPVITGIVQLTGITYKRVVSSFETYTGDLYEEINLSETFGYTLDNSYPFHTPEEAILTINYYDNYNLLNWYSLIY